MDNPQLNAIANMIRKHGHFARVEENSVMASCEAVYSDGAVCCTMPEPIKTWKECRDWLGY